MLFVFIDVLIFMSHSFFSAVTNISSTVTTVTPETSSAGNVV